MRARRYDDRAVRAFIVLPALLLAASCGARTSLELDGVLGGGGGGTTAETTSASPASTGTGFEPCEARTLDAQGEGAVVLRTVGEITYYNTVDGRLMRGDLETGVETVLAAGETSIGDIATFDGDVFFSDTTGIWRIPGGTGSPSLVIGLPSTSFGIAVDATGLYWIEGPGSLANHEIKRFTPNGEVIPIAQVIQYPLGLSVGPGGVLYTDPYDFSADPGAVRVSSIQGGSTSTLVAESVPYPELPFQRDGFFYWVEASDENITNHGGIARAAASGGAREKVLFLDGQYPISATADGEHYFMTVLSDPRGRSQLIAADYPVAGVQTLLADEAGVFFSMVASTPKRVVWTSQKGVGSDAPVDGVRSLCRSAISFQ